MARNGSCRSDLRVVLMGGALLALACTAGPPRAVAGHRARASRDGVPAGAPYPLEVVTTFPAALFHWVDSLAGTSFGKTVRAYRDEYLEHFGGPSRHDQALLVRFADVRKNHATALAPEDSQSASEPNGPSALLGVFLEAPTVSSALERLGPELSPEDLDALRRTLDHFGPRYERIWRDGKVAVRFKEQLLSHPGRDRLSELLWRMARFFEVDPAAAPAPRLVLVPVPHGYGTHAQAVGRHLLVEVRSGDRLADQASVIAHENAHFLVGLMDPARLEALESFVAGAHPRGRGIWETLREALPTALGQGVADSVFRPHSWSLDDRWYHTAPVDAYAKAIYPLVREALDSGARFDEGFLGETVRRYPAVGPDPGSDP